MDEKEKNKDILLTVTSNNSIIYNENCIPDENEIKKQLSLYNRELLNNIEINFDDIMKNNIAISTLILSKKNNPSLNIMNDIITLIKTIDKYKNIPNEKILKDLEVYIQNLKNNDINQESEEQSVHYPNILTSISEIKNKEETVFNRLYNRRKKFQIEIKPIINKSYSNETRDIFNKLYLNETYREMKSHQNYQRKNFKIKSSIKSKMLLYNKYRRQFERNLDELFKEGKLTFCDRLNYDEYILFMKKIGYLNFENNEIEINLAKKIFQFLQINKLEKYIPIKNLFIFTLSILNLNYYNNDENYKVSNETHKRSISSTSSSSRISINKFSNHYKFNVLIINSIQSKKIFTDYIILYYNWKKNQTNHREIFTNKNLTFKPVINNEYNQKIKGNLFSHISKYQNIKKINDNNLKQKQLQIETQECTFKPQLTNYNFNFERKPLFNNLSNKNEIQLKNRTTVNKSIKEYTFKPDLSLTKNYFENHQNLVKNKYTNNNNSFKKIEDKNNSFNHIYNSKNYSLKNIKLTKNFSIRNLKNSKNHSYKDLKYSNNYSLKDIQNSNDLTVKSIKCSRNNSLKDIQNLKNYSIKNKRDQHSLTKIKLNSFHRTNSFLKDNNNKYSRNISHKKELIQKPSLNENEKDEIKNIYKSKNYYKTYNSDNSKNIDNNPQLNNKDNLYYKKNVTSPVFKHKKIINYNPIDPKKKLFLNKPLFILDINLTNKNQKIFIHKDIDIDKTVSDFVKENKIDDPKNVEFIKDLIQTELGKFK